MSQVINIYCDESCHQENDHHKAMVLGAVVCPQNDVKLVSNEIKELKKKYGLKTTTEVKWVKVSDSKIKFYLELINLFFEYKQLSFRALVIPDKSILNHPRFHQTHDEWYYKMYFEMLRPVLSTNNTYNIYLDIKDTRSAKKVDKLHQVLCNSNYDFNKEVIKKVQVIRSHESQLLQLADLLIGAIGYKNRNMHEVEYASKAKIKLLEFIQQQAGFLLTDTTPLSFKKINILIWKPRGININGFVE